MNSFGRNIMTGLFVIILLISTAPFYLWGYSTSIAILMGYVILLFFASFNFKKTAVPFALLFLFYLISALHQYQNPPIAVRILSFLPLFLFLINGESATKIFKWFTTVYALFLIPSILTYISVIIMGVDLPHHTIDPLNQEKQYLYSAYTFMVTDGSIRFHAYFDEPGVVGTINGILLLANNCNFKDWKNWVLLVGGIFSCSKFFFVLVIVYLLLFGSKKTRITVVVLLVGIISFCVYYFKDAFIDFIFLATQIDESYDLNSRTSESFEPYFKRFLHSSDLFFGYGRGSCAKYFDPGGSSWKDLLFDVGLIPFLVYLIGLALFYAIKSDNRRKTLIVLMLSFATIFQRPGVYGMLTVFLIVVPLYTLETKKAVE